MRDELLKRWVTQPPANPNVQYLRDAERRATHDLLDSPGTVLDVASEATLTRELSGAEVTRLDFSPATSKHARDVLGDDVDSFAVTDPGEPSLPFSDDDFDAAVSIGPYDWRFLDVNELTDELHRVLDRGPLVFSVPTPRSPYASTDMNRLRYVEPSAARGLVSPDWVLQDRELLFQYPAPVNGVVNRLPADLQERFVPPAERASELIDRYDRWDLASYLVLRACPIPYESYLEDAIQCLFRPVGEDGFWDTSEEKFVRALDFEKSRGDLTWTPDDSIEWRYAPFAIAGTMRWRASPIGDERFDDRIRRELAYFGEKVSDANTLSEMPSYGVGPLVAAFAIAAREYGDEEYLSIARDLFEHSREAFDFTHAEDSLLAYGWSYLFEASADEDVESALEDAIWSMSERLSPDGVFEFENHTTRRHQNQMYTLWGLCRAIEVTGETGYLENARRVLDRTIERRMLDSGAFIWEDVSAGRRLRRDLERRAGRDPPHWDLLYSCHQTFFVNAVAHFYRAGGERVFDDATRRAMEWVYETNEWEANLVDVAGIGVPMRGMTVRGTIDDDQRFKGAYEVGAYVMALTELLAGPFTSTTAVPSGTPTDGEAATQDRPVLDARSE